MNAAAKEGPAVGGRIPYDGIYPKEGSTLVGRFLRIAIQRVKSECRS